MNLERYHVMSGSEILQKLNMENPSRNTSTKNHAMMAWENLMNQLMNMKMTQKIIIYLRMKNLSKRT